MTAAAAIAVLGGGLAINAWMNRDPETKVYEGPVAGHLLLVSSDGQTLTLSIGWGCEKQPKLVVRESTGTVKVSLRHTVPPGFCDPGGIGQITTHLNKPLGTRALNDATDRPAVHFDEHDLHRPAFLPENYYPYPAGRMAQLPGLAPLPTDTPAWASGYRLGTDPEQGSLIISQILRNGTPPEGRAATIKGHPATITPPNSQGSPRSLTWSDGTYTFVVTTGGPPRLSDEELIHVGESLGS
ncbi:hypothetical protein AB0F92_40960 [Kitasatospora aureofaciens]|uniref:hypothetical protein n=1 Tax=Kitasatospora aureofaciens TaxID=1894 RepID=UPI00092CB585|nr:hypothetical protein CP971_33880 [Streptomyces viridifaciens]UKZ03763.1 hypothetical protein BOQ63_006700 [Streptomyces viridifaciens]